jgi:hypothetical protein
MDGIINSSAAPLTELPRYRSHKIVRAVKIDRVVRGEGNGWLIYPADSSFAPIAVSSAYVETHAPQWGGYYVVYEDGYESWSPAQAFEEGYTRVPQTTARPDLESIFTYHSPKGDQPDRYVRLREKAKELAYLIAETTPSSREQSLALTHVQTAVMFANAAIAIHE